MYTKSPPPDPLGELSRGVRRIRAGDDVGSDRELPVWQYGLGFDLGLAAGAVWITTTRSRTPLYRVPKGVRVAYCSISVEIEISTTYEILKGGRNGRP